MKDKAFLARVLLDPARDVVLPAHVLNEIMPELADLTVHIKMVINQVVQVECGATTPKQFEEICGIIPSMPDPLAAKDLPPIDVETIDQR